MANRYANLVGTNKIRDEFGKINDGFQTVQDEMDGKSGNAFAQVNSVAAGEPSDTLTIEAGTGITIVDVPEEMKLRIVATGEATPGEHGIEHNHDGSDPIPELVQAREDIAALQAETVSRAINIKYPPVPLVGAIGDGETDDTDAVQAILDFAGLNELSVEIPSGEFLVTALTSGECKFIFGHGENSVLKTSTTSTILTLDGDSTIISSVKFLGTGLNQKGIVNDGYFKCEVVGCIFDNLKGTGGGIFVSEVGTSQHGHLDGMKITNCKFYKCYHGIDCGMNAEYVTIDGCVFQEQCSWAIWGVSGNVLINGCNITKCQNGIYIAGKEGSVPSNGAHSSITACNINHIFTDNGDETYTTGYALWFQDVDLGEVVTSCAIFDANIMFNTSKGININNCILGVVNYVFDGADGCTIENNYFYKAYGHNITPNSNGHPSFVQWQNNKTFDGLHGDPIEEIRGGQVKGTITGQSITNGAAETTIAVTAVSNSANYPDQQKHPWWNSSTNKAKNLGYGGNRIQIDVQFYVEYGSGADLNFTLGYLRVGSKIYALNRVVYAGTNTYYSFSGDVVADPDDEIYMTLLNNSGQTATVKTTNGRFVIEGL